MVVLELDRIAKSYSGGFWGKKREVLTNLSLEIRQGEVYGLLGHNGAGKTTTMRVILGLLSPDAGRVSVFGESGGGRISRARIGYLSDEIGLYPQFNAEEAVNLTGELYRLDRAVLAERRTNLLETVGLVQYAKRRVKGYSRGMRQRLGIALALLNDPDLLILDEPYSGLDPVGRRQVRELLLRLKAQGKTILLSSHIVPDVEAVCDRVGILSGGRILRSMALNDIYSQKSTPVEVTASGIDATAFDHVVPVELVLRNGDAVVMRCEGSNTVEKVITEVYARGGTVLEVKPLKFSLEDYLLEALADTDAEAEPEIQQPKSEETTYAHSR